MASPISIPSSAVPARSPDKPWTSHLTLDLLLHILNRSLFHPFIAFLIPLCLRAQATPWHAPSMQYTLGWASFVTTCHILAALNRRIAYGLPREVDLEEEVVVITGGSSGLGALLAEVYGMRGVGVAVLDIKGKEEELEEKGVKLYKCDVGDRAQVEGAARAIEQDLGTPTIIINCAASSITGARLPSLSPISITQTLSTNLLSHFHTSQTFLPGMLSSTTGGTIVTISSVLAHLAPANLSAYSASKAALSALHTSITAEIRVSKQDQKIKTLLVETGQMATPLFDGVRTSNSFFAPVLEPVEVAREIVELIDAGKGGVIRLPAYAGWISWYAVLPAGVQRMARWLSGIDRAMEQAAAVRRMAPEKSGEQEVVEEARETESGSDEMVVV